MIFTKPLILLLFLIDPGVDHFCFSSDCRDQSVKIEQEVESREIVIAEKGGVYFRDDRRDVEPFNFVQDDCALRSNFRQVIIFSHLAVSLTPKNNFVLWEKMLKKAAKHEHCVEPDVLHIHTVFSVYMLCNDQKILIMTGGGNACNKAQEIIDSLDFPSIKGQ